MINQLETSNEYLSFFIFVFLSLGFCFFMLFLSWVLGGKSNARYKNTPFESGIASVDNDHLNFSVKFYLIAMFFVVFDVEALYLYAWSVSVFESGWVGFFEAFMFIFSIILGLIYLIRVKALNWIS